MTDKELDNLIKQKLNNQTFDFDEKYWEMAALEIDNQRLHNKKLVWYKTSFYAAIIGLFGLLGWFLISNQNLSNVQTVNNANTFKNGGSKLNIETNTTTTQTKPNNNLDEKQNSTSIEKYPLAIEPNSSNHHLLAFTENTNIQSIDNQHIVKELTENTLVIDGINVKHLANNVPLPAIGIEKINFENKLLQSTKNKNVLGTLNASLEAGFNSFNAPLGKNSTGYYLGARVYFDIGKLSFNSNLHFENISQNLAPRSIINKTYDFTSNTEVTTIKNNSLNYAILGLNALYPIYKNHSIGVGMQYAILVQSNDLFTTQNIERNTILNQKAHNYNSNLNKTDWQITVNYQFRFSKHIALGATYVQGLTNVSKTEATGYNNHGIKVGLQYIIK